MQELMRQYGPGIKLHWWQRLYLRIALRQHRKAWAEYTRRLYGVPLPPPRWDYDEEESEDENPQTRMFQEDRK